jgi:hypothetical protein
MTLLTDPDENQDLIVHWILNNGGRELPTMKVTALCFGEVPCKHTFLESEEQ